ncbi:Transcriptional regulator of ribosomal biogenesis proteins [Entophlyctis luteolus]|nr:Transcriptional regulator of ribosomal biogenesis proteins [Entophlyctis luteolus]
MGSTVALSPPNRDVSDASPKTSFYTPPTSLSPEMSPRTNTDSTLMSQMLMDFDDEAPAGGPFMFSDESGFVKINHQQHQKQPQQPYRFQQSRRDSADTVNVGCDDRGLVNAACPQGGAVDSLLAFEEAGEDVGRPGVFEGSAMGIDILERLERMGMHQQLSADDELEKSLTMILLQSEADGPLLNSGTVESRSPPAVPLVRFGPHHEDITTSSSSIALAEIYRQDDESEGSSPNANVKMSGVPTAIPSVVVPVQMFDFEESDKETSDSDAETSYSRDSMEVASFQIDLENWDLTGATNLFENPVRSTVATAAAHRARPAARRTLSMPMLSKLNKIKAGHAGVLGQSSNSSACVSKQLESKPTARSTKKMRVAAAGAAAALASRTLLDVETVASIITASSPILTPPHRTATPGAALRKAPMRRASLGSSGLASDIVDGADEHMATAVAGAGVAVCTTSALSASIAASRRAAAAVVANVGAIDDEDASIGSSSALGGRNDDDDADDAEMFVFPKPRRSAGGASATAAGALGTSSRARKPSRSATMPATLTTPRATPTAVMKVRKAASGLSGVKEHMELDPAFARRFKSRTVAEQAAQTLEALREGATLADIVIRRLPKVKAGEERRLKLGSLSILDPHTLDKRFFCPVCKKEYKNANGLKYHLNHSHVEPNELPAGYYFGKKKKEAEDMSKPFVCTVRKCGKRYKNLNGLKYHIEHGHVLSADAKGDADPDASGASDESEEESDDS